MPHELLDPSLEPARPRAARSLASPQEMVEVVDSLTVCLIRVSFLISAPMVNEVTQTRGVLGRDKIEQWLAP